MLCFRNVNSAFEYLVGRLQATGIEEESRNGPVLRFDMPVIWRYDKPCERVLFNQARDANPFFHMYEAMWMLAGMDGLVTLGYYCKQMFEYSDDGRTINDAYGYRWRHYFAFDQLNALVKELRDRETRRAVLEMWDANRDLGSASKAIPCNTHCYFSVTSSYLNLTVCNRSNDLVWGAMGANAVHFSFLLEYMASQCGLKVGRMYTMSNNLHAYKANWKPDKWLHDPTPSAYELEIGTTPLCLAHEVDHLAKNIVQFATEPQSRNDNQFLDSVARPMMLAWEAHKRRDYRNAEGWCDLIEASDWRIASVNWLKKRRRLWEHDDK